MLTYKELLLAAKERGLNIIKSFNDGDNFIEIINEKPTAVLSIINKREFVAHTKAKRGGYCWGHYGYDIDKVIEAFNTK